MQDTKSVLEKIKNVNAKHPEGFPEETINLGCDVENMFGSISQEFGTDALRAELL